MQIDEADPASVLAAVRAGGQTVDLGRGLTLQARRVAGEQRLEITGGGRITLPWLKSLGCFSETHQFTLRVFMPNDERAEGILHSILSAQAQAA